MLISTNPLIMKKYKIDQDYVDKNGIPCLFFYKDNNHTYVQTFSAIMDNNLDCFTKSKLINDITVHTSGPAYNPKERIMTASTRFYVNTPLPFTISKEPTFGCTHEGFGVEPGPLMETDCMWDKLAAIHSVIVKYINKKTKPLMVSLGDLIDKQYCLRALVPLPKHLYHSVNLGDYLIDIANNIWPVAIENSTRFYISTLESVSWLINAIQRFEYDIRRHGDYPEEWSEKITPDSKVATRIRVCIRDNKFDLGKNVILYHTSAGCNLTKEETHNTFILNDEN